MFTKLVLEEQMSDNLTITVPNDVYDALVRDAMKWRSRSDEKMLTAVEAYTLVRLFTALELNARDMHRSKDPMEQKTGLEMFRHIGALRAHIFGSAIGDQACPFVEVPE